MNQKDRQIMGVGLCLLLFFSLADLAAAASIEYTPSVAVNGQYNDNILFQRTDVVDDFLLNLAPSLKFNYLDEQFTLKSFAEIILRRYLDETQYDREDYELDLWAGYRMTERLALKGRINYKKDFTLESSEINAGDDFTEPDDIGDGSGDVVEPGIERFYSERERYRAWATLRYSLTEVSDMNIGYRYLQREYDLDANTDSKISTVNVNYLRQLAGEKNTIGPGFSYTRYTSDVSDADSYALTFRWDHKFTETMRLESNIGARYTQRDVHRLDESVDAWTGLADIRFIQQGEKSLIKLGFRQDLQTGSGSQISNVPWLYWNYMQWLSERWSLRLNGDFYVDKEDINFDIGDNKLFFDVITSLTYAITENHTVSLAYSYTIKSDRALEENPDRQRNRIWLMFEFGFPGML